MDNQKIEGHLRAICFNNQKKSFNIKDYDTFWMKNGVQVYLMRKELEHFNQVVALISSDSLFAKSFSRKDIENSVKEIITRLLTKNERSTLESRIKQEVSNLENELKSKIQEWTFYIPLENIKFSRKAKVCEVYFFKYSNYHLNKEIKELTEKMKDNPHYDDKGKKAIVEGFKKIFQGINNRYCAKVVVKGTFEGAKEKALQKTEEVLSLIKLYSPINYSFGHLAYFGIEGDIIRWSHRVILGKTEKTTTPSTEKTGYLFSYEYHDAQLIKFRKKASYQKAINLLQNKNSNEVYKRILSSIYWYSKSFDVPLMKGSSNPSDSQDNYERNQYNLSQKFLNAIISLESLLVFNNEAKTKNISERGSYILSDKKEQRDSIKKLLRDCYDLRSKIVHEGYNFISERDVKILMNHVQMIIIVLMRNLSRWKIKTNEELYQWFEKQRLKERL